MSLASDGRGDGAFARSPSRVPIYLYLFIGALLRYNRVSSLPKVYSSRQISSARRSRRGEVTSIEAGATYQ